MAKKRDRQDAGTGQPEMTPADFAQACAEEGFYPQAWDDDAATVSVGISPSQIVSVSTAGGCRPTLERFRKARDRHAATIVAQADAEAAGEDDELPPGEDDELPPGEDDELPPGEDE